tara:strand:- start:1384 stop:1593 length:210 start_codon:yes stop_codon:yes gene_type:complete
MDKELEDFIKNYDAYKIKTNINEMVEFSINRITLEEARDIIKDYYKEQYENLSPVLLKYKHSQMFGDKT